MSQNSIGLSGILSVSSSNISSLLGLKSLLSSNCVGSILNALLENLSGVIWVSSGFLGLLGNSRESNLLVVVMMVMLLCFLGKILLGKVEGSLFLFFISIVILSKETIIKIKVLFNFSERGVFSGDNYKS
jgi:hypothetical protein